MQEEQIVLPEMRTVGTLILNRRRLSDLQEVKTAIGASIAELGAFLRWAAEGVPSHAQLTDTFNKRDPEFEAGTAFDYVLRELGGEVVGEAGGQLSHDPTTVEIGYWVRSDRTGCGYATAAARALTSLVFETYPNVVRVELRMDSGNAASRAIAQRLGFVHLGDETFSDEPLPGQTGLGHIYATDRDAWLGASHG